MASLMLSRICVKVVHQIRPSKHQLLMTFSRYSVSSYGTLPSVLRSTILRPSQRTVLIGRPVSTRLFGTTCGRTAKRTQRSWDVDGMVSKDTVVYSYRNDRYYRLITIFGITQLIFWGNLAIFSYSGLSKIDEHAIKDNFDSGSFWGKALEYQVKYKYRIAVVCVAVGYAVMFFTWMYPQRSIRKLTLLTGGQNVRVTTYTHLGKTRDFEVPLSVINSNQTRTVDQPTMTFKIKGHWFYYIIDKKNGVFHEPALFDNVVNLKRNIK